jgi:hypothetical protein
MNQIVNPLARFSFILILVFSVGLYLSQPDKSENKCANSLSCKESFQPKVENNVLGQYNGETVIPPFLDTRLEHTPKVLSDTTTNGSLKHIYVDLFSQTLSAYEDNVLYMETFISSGKWFPTPTGEFKIWHKVRSTRMSGGEGRDYYDLPNVPFVMFFAGSGISPDRGFGFHGAYWHNNFGHPMSHGCINMRSVDAEKLYNWATEDTIVNIYGKNPG